MSRTFDSVGALASFLENVARTVPQAEREALDEATKYGLEKVDGIIGTYQSDPAWPALAEATVADRVRRGFSPDDPLRRSGEFAKSFGRHVGDERHAEIGTNDPRGIYFEAGTSRMPPRPVLGALKAQHDHHLQEIIARRIQRHIGGRD